MVSSIALLRGDRLEFWVLDKGIKWIETDIVVNNQKNFQVGVYHLDLYKAEKEFFSEG